MDYNSKSEIRQLLDSKGLQFQKQFGQNFMILESARLQMLKACHVNEGSRVWEIGPGIGSFTHHLIESKVDLTVFEIDKGYVALLSDLFPGLHIVSGDALKSWETMKESGLPDSIVGNLPYNVGSILIGKFLESGWLSEYMAYTVQKQVAERMVAQPGSKQYSGFSVLCQSCYDVKIEALLSRNAFFPAPDVSSAIVGMKRKAIVPGDMKVLSRFIQDLFRSRRKTIKNNIQKAQFLSPDQKVAVAAHFKSAGIELSRRAETLEVTDFIAAAETLS